MSWSESAVERVKSSLLTGLTPPLAGLPLGDWLRFMRKHRFDVDPVYWPKLVLNAICSALTSLMKRREERIYGTADDQAAIPPPLFVLGHYRSGTTLLHNLLAVDERFAFPTMFRNYNPHTFRVFEPIGAPLAGRVLPRRRIVDGMVWGTDLPQEDELALLMLTGMSPYLGFIFARQAEQFERYLSFRDVPRDAVRRWQQGFTWFVRKLTQRDGRPLLLKSPPHTARIRLLLEMFPGARFVHVHREPYTVFRSTRQLFERVTAMVGFQRPPRRRTDERVLRQYRLMYDAFFADRPLAPPGQFHEIRFAELERDPLAALEQTYAALNLPGFEATRPALAAYIGTLRGYRQNRYPPLTAAQRRRVAETWRPCFEAWGYDI